jgi:hypothetical protein
MESNEVKELVFYFRDQIEEIGFTSNPNGVRGWYLEYGFLEWYSIYIDAIGYIDNVWTIKLCCPQPIYDNHKRAMMYSSNLIKEIAVGKVTNYWSLDMDKENINDFLEYIKNTDGVKSRLRKKKLKKINGRLGIKI